NLYRWCFLADLCISLRSSSLSSRRPTALDGGSQTQRFSGAFPLTYGNEWLNLKRLGRPLAAEPLPAARRSPDRPGFRTSARRPPSLAFESTRCSRAVGSPGSGGTS